MDMKKQNKGQGRRVNLSLPPYLAEEVKAIAQAEGLTIGQAVAYMAHNYIIEHYPANADRMQENER